MLTLIAPGASEEIVMRMKDATSAILKEKLAE
jgi:hypothetical protein